jgi:hypothetical protein
VNSASFAFGGSHQGNYSTLTVNLSTGAVSGLTLASGENYGVQAMSNGFWKVWYSSTLSSGTGYVPQISFAAGNVIVGGLQIEEMAYATHFVDVTRGKTLETWGGLADLSNNGNHGAIYSNPTYDSVRKSLVFDGLNDYVGVLSPNNKFAWTPSGVGKHILSFEMWVKTSDTNGNLITKPWNGGGEYNYQVKYNYAYFEVLPQSKGVYFTSLATGNWEHLVVIVTSTGVAVYRNGVLDIGFVNHDITNNTPVGVMNDLELILMTLYPYGDPWAGQTGYSVAGNVAVFRVYDRVLSAAEVLYNFNALYGRFYP